VSNLRIIRKDPEEAPELDDESGCGVEPATANNRGFLDKNIVTVTTE
jgi:hypothetical protein